MLPAIRFSLLAALLLVLSDTAQAWQVQTQKTGESDNSLSLSVWVKNDGAAAASGKVALSYHVDPTDHRGHALVPELDWSSIAGVQLRAVTGAASLEVQADFGTKVFAPGEEVQVNLRLHLDDWGTATWSNDWSYGGLATTRAANAKVTLALNGAAVYGQAPVATPPSPSGTLTPRDYAIFSTTQTLLKERVKISGAAVGSNGYLETGANGQIAGDVLARGNVLLRSGGVITGNIRATGSITRQTGVTVTGELKQGVAVQALSIATLPITVGTRDFLVQGGGSLTIDPGSYRDFKSFGPATIFLRSGTYHFRRFELEPRVRLVFDVRQGPVDIRVQDALSFGDYTNFDLVGSTRAALVDFYSNQTGVVRIGTDCDFQAALTAPRAEIDVFSRTHLVGALYGDKVTIEPDIGSITGGNQNGAPVITSSPLLQITPGSLYLYDAEATDPDFDALSWRLISAPPGLAINAQSGILNWTPTSVQVGKHAVSIEVSDGWGGTAIQNFEIEVYDPNRAPVITSAAATSGREGAPYLYAVLASDPDGDALSFTTGALPPGMTWNAQSRAFAWTPGYDQSGSYPLWVQVADGRGGVARQDFTLLVAEENRPPVFTSMPGLTGKEGEAYSYAATASDPDGHALSFTAGTLPAGMVFDAATATFTWTPGYDAAGAYPLSITVADGQGGQAIQTFTLVVANSNRAPVVTSVPVTAGKEGESYAYGVTASDPDGDALSFTASSLPAGMVFDAATATLSWNPGFDAAGS